jgi:hypothetical protein
MNYDQWKTDVDELFNKLTGNTSAELGFTDDDLRIPHGDGITPDAFVHRIINKYDLKII